MKVEKQLKWTNNHPNQNVKGNNQWEATRSHGDVKQKSVVATNEMQNSRPTINYQDHNQRLGYAVARTNVLGYNNNSFQSVGHIIICYKKQANNLLVNEEGGDNDDEEEFAETQDGGGLLEFTEDEVTYEDHDLPNLVVRHTMLTQRAVKDNWRRNIACMSDLKTRRLQLVE
ncbi:hypothetical protein LWI28_022863 [Acer negundo]|uniref:Uncharacterized protein n=1 Tax=Acer negundo TaxID=4023 RepID=A0AAD5NQN6_ACENE|nr:hypothetical protein LWI28_022863 [Acer negundo]